MRDFIDRFKYFWFVFLNFFFGIMKNQILEANLKSEIQKEIIENSAILAKYEPVATLDSFNTLSIYFTVNTTKDFAIIIKRTDDETTVDQNSSVGSISFDVFENILSELKKRKNKLVSIFEKYFDEFNG